MAENLWTPEDFAAEQPPERIIGLETEYDIRPLEKGKFDLNWMGIMFSDDGLALAGLQQNVCTVKHWLSNGALVYPDVGHLEYCTPESLGPMEATAATHAGSILLNRLIAKTEAQYRIYRRSATVDPENGAVFTKGFHENFGIPNEIATIAATQVLESHLATQIYAWGGLVTKQGYSISPKARDIGQGVTASLGTRTSAGLKPMAIVRHGDNDDINIRAHGYGRFEDRTKTPSSPWSDFMGMATTSVLLRVLEHPSMAAEQQMLHSLRLHNSVASFKSVSTDMSMTCLLMMGDGRLMTALDIQERFAEIAEKATKKMELPADEVFAVHQWQQILIELRKIQKGDAGIRLIADRVGWASKYAYLSRKLGKEAVQRGDITALRYCLGWDMVAPRGAGQVFDEKFGPELLDANKVEQLTHEPPQETRANVRGGYIADGGTRLSSLGDTNWPIVELVQSTGSKRITLHPYESKRPKIGARKRRKW